MHVDLCHAHMLIYGNIIDCHEYSYVSAFVFYQLLQHNVYKYVASHLYFTYGI